MNTLSSRAMGLYVISGAAGYRAVCNRWIVLLAESVIGGLRNWQTLQSADRVIGGLSNRWIA